MTLARPHTPAGDRAPYTPIDGADAAHDLSGRIWQTMGVIVEANPAHPGISELCVKMFEVAEGLDAYARATAPDVHAPIDLFPADMIGGAK